MAKVILVCTRDSGGDPFFSKKIDALSRRLSPDNITPAPPATISDSGILIGIINPCACLPIKNASVCMGNLIQPREDWSSPQAQCPEGSYALFRSDENSVELVSDMLGTRTVWYIQTEDVFLASTSQRAITFFLQDFKPNREVFPWMLSSGTLGPGLAWDIRIQSLPVNARLLLDRKSWKLSLQKTPFRIAPFEIPDIDHENQLKETIADVFKKIDLDYSKWVLPLSGGKDSRAILLHLLDRKDLKCITWGLKDSLKDKQNDAYIAKTLTRHFDLEHQFFETDLSDESFDLLFERFLVAGEGRSDNIAGYMDGFKIWKHLFECGYYGVIRGDQPFGNRRVTSAKDVYKNMGLHILSDFHNLDPIAEVIRMYGQRRPQELEIRENETLEDWRERVSAEFEFPVIFAALNDIKLPFVEIVNPLLTHSIVQRVRQLPASLRTDKRLFLKILNAMSPAIPYAQRRAVALTEDCLNARSVIDVIRDELHSEHARSLLPEDLIHVLDQRIKVKEDITLKKPSPMRGALRRVVPKRLRKWRKSKITKRTLDWNTLGLRAFLICRMTQKLEEDARIISHLPFPSEMVG